MDSAFGFYGDGVVTMLTYLVAATTIVSGGGYIVRWGRGAPSAQVEP